MTKVKKITHYLPHLLLALTILYTSLFFFSKQDFINADLGRHLTNGRLVFSHPEILTQNFYSYTNSDYSFINPPAGLADFLRSTQNWIPYEGAITLEEEDVGATRYRGNKINLINSIPAYSTMGALVSGESLEIESGRTTINLGAPARNDYRTLVDKIRKTSQDNIVYV